MAQYFFYFDQTRCMGCNACTVQCKDFNNIQPGPVRWREVHSVEEGNFPQTKVYNTVYSCNHCEAPACVSSCPQQAISKDEATGAVRIDRAKCIEVGACIAACPYSAISIATDAQEQPRQEGWQTAHPAQKCDMCFERISTQIERGEKPQPACVHSCIQRAIDFGTEAELKEKYAIFSSINRYVDGEVQGFPADQSLDGSRTRPSILIRKKEI
ncbi:MAG: 4Fe-4S dicluster domain-containing protein [Deferribacteraceae bacterium]|jgi:anaerobic dimethyl sulfoxide reductase subunit B (iron-sulfur subunit)|nr:4Fe-4S dicluster domain-containing protein [Deferribacteraceae bacterium]